MLTMPAKTTLKDLQTMDIEKVAFAAEADAGHPIPGLRKSLAEAKAGIYGAVHTPEMIIARQGLAANPKHQDNSE